MTKLLLFGLLAAAAIGGIALASRSASTPQPGAPAVAAPVADAPSARGIFPKVLNH